MKTFLIIYLAFECCFVNAINYTRLGEFAGLKKESPADIQEFIIRVFEIADTRYNRTNLFDFPHYSVENGADWLMVPADKWIVGFLPGIYWKLFTKTKSPTFQNLAFKSQERFKFRQFDINTHDVGFTMINSYYLTLQLNAYKSAQQKVEYEKIIVNSAKSLASRFNWLVGCTRSWNNDGTTGFRVIIDNMMNIELLIIASKLAGGDSSWFQMAVSHADMTMKNHIRSDGSTYQLVIYDENGGAVIQKTTTQGYAPDSTWTRGQAWGIYGFAKMYFHTNDPKYLETSLKLLEYYFSRLPFNHYIPKWDFSAPGTGLDLTNQDTSAAMIIASALSDLAKYTLNPVFRKLSINTYWYLFNRTQDYIPDSPDVKLAGVLQHGTSNAPKNLVDHALVYGDFYLLEGLLKLY